MTKPERVLTALGGGAPDCVPYMYSAIMGDVQEKIVAGNFTSEPILDGFVFNGWLGSIGEMPDVAPALTVLPETARALELDAIGIQILPPLFVDAVNASTGRFIKGGQITGAEALRKIKMPDPDDPALYREIGRMIGRYKQEFALYARIRLGASPTLLSMGIVNFSFCLADEEDTVAGVIELYTEWSRRVSLNLSELDFDFFWCFDDIAFSTGMLFSPQVFRRYFKEPMKRAASGIKKPFIYHSDGDFSLVLDDIIEIGAGGLHPI